MHTCQGLAEDAQRVVISMLLLIEWSVKKHCVAKVLLAVLHIFLHENNCNYNCYKFILLTNFSLVTKFSYFHKGIFLLVVTVPNTVPWFLRLLSPHYVYSSCTSSNIITSSYNLNFVLWSWVSYFVSHST